jgi:hypothetical protein
MTSHRVLLTSFLLGAAACGGAVVGSSEDGRTEQTGAGGRGGGGGSSTTASGSGGTTTMGTSGGTSGTATTGTGGGTTTGTGGGTSGATTGMGGTAGSWAAGSGGAAGSSGGGSGAGGSAGDDAGPDVVRDARYDASYTCMDATPGSVTFRMQVATGARYCMSRCEFWVSVFREDGGPLRRLSGLSEREYGCVIRCDSCRQICTDSGGGIDVGCPPRPLLPEGETYVWDGAFWEMTDRCSSRFYCDDRFCAAAGRYVARMCANKTAPDAGSATPDAGSCEIEPTPTCVDVPFDYPPSAPVVGVLP